MTYGRSRHSPEISVSDQFCTDAHGDLGDRLAADVDTERRENFVQFRLFDSVIEQILEDQLDLPFAADHAEVASAAVYQMKQRFLIVVVASGDNETIRLGRNLQVGQYLGNDTVNSSFRCGEPFLGNAVAAIVDDPHIEVELRREGGHRLSNVPAAHNDESAAR